MRLAVITPAGAEIVTLEEAKAHLNVTVGDDDALIERLIKTAVAKLDGERGVLGRCLAPTQLRLSLSAFTDEIVLPLPPTRSVERIEYVDATGMPRVMEPEAYRIAGLDDDVGARIVRSPRHPWPYTAGGPDAVRITFTAGYDTVPVPLASAILMHVAHLYENREASLVGVSAQVLPMGYQDLVDPYAVWEC